MADELSAQELQQLKEIAKALPAGHPAQNKVNLLLSSQPTQFEKERTPEGSALWRGTKAVAGDVVGAIKGMAEAVPGMKTIRDIGSGEFGKAALDVLPGVSETQNAFTRLRDIGHADTERKQAGYSPLYRGASAVGQASGVIDPTAMEELAKHGDTAAIAGHTVLPLIGAAVGADEALGGKARAALSKAKTTLPNIESPDFAGITKKNPALTRLILGDRLSALKELFSKGKEETPKLDPFAGATSSAKPIGSAELPKLEPTTAPETIKSIGQAQQPAQVAPTRLPTLFEKGTRPATLKMPELIDQAAGVKPLKPDVPLREQLTPQPTEIGEVVDPIKAKYPDPAVRQMVRANGERIYEAAKSKPETVKALHDLTRVDLRQALIAAGEDMGQTTVSNSKFAGEGSIPREEAFNRLLDRGITPEKILELAKKTHKLSEKAELMGAPRKTLGPEFEEGERAHEVERNKSILRNPKATLEDRRIAQQRLDEALVPEAPAKASNLPAQRAARQRAARIREARP